MPGAQSNLARRGPVPFGSLPAATTTITLERALELAGCDETELTLAASTTFKEARSLEELVSLVAATRRRGLDPLLRHIYYERFGGADSEPSLHVAIDGLRAIAAATGRYGGRLEPRFYGVVGEVLEGGRKRTAPERCVMTVYAIVKGQKCAFEGEAWWDEAYPGDGPRGRMWRLRPRGMLSIAAERQALRSAFPAETSGLGDYDAGDDDAMVVEAKPPTPPADDAATLAMYNRTLGAAQELPPETPRRDYRADLRQAYEQLLEDTIARGRIAEGERDRWQLPGEADEAAITRAGRALRLVAEPLVRPVDVRSPLAQRLAELIQEAAAMDLDYADCEVSLPAREEEVRRAIERLDDRIGDARKALMRLDEDVAQALPLS